MLVGESGEVMVRRKTGLPARERHSTLWWQILEMYGSDWENIHKAPVSVGTWDLIARLNSSVPVINTYSHDTD